MALKALKEVRPTGVQARRDVLGLVNAAARDHQALWRRGGRQYMPFRSKGSKGADAGGGPSGWGMAPTVCARVGWFS